VLEFNTLENDLNFSVIKISDSALVNVAQDFSEIETNTNDIVVPPRLIDASVITPVKLTLTVNEANSLFLIKWSNEHSWFTSKTLQYSYKVLSPLSNQQVVERSFNENVLLKEWIVKSDKSISNLHDCLILYQDSKGEICYIENDVSRRVEGKTVSEFLKVHKKPTSSSSCALIMTSRPSGGAWAKTMEDLKLEIDYKKTPCIHMYNTDALLCIQIASMKDFEGITICIDGDTCVSSMAK
jgi:hypothetical protein